MPKITYVAIVIGLYILVLIIVIENNKDVKQNVKKFVFNFVFLMGRLTHGDMSCHLTRGVLWLSIKTLIIINADGCSSY